MRCRNRKGKTTVWKIITSYGDEFVIISKQTAEDLTNFFNNARADYIEFVTFELAENKHIILKLSEISHVEEL